MYPRTQHIACIPRIAQHGFTLVEIMVAAVVASILLAIAIPSYTGYVQRGHRAQARVTALAMAQYAERVATASGRYPSEAGANGTGNFTAATLNVDGGRYTPSYEELDGSDTVAPNGYKITLKRVNTMGNKDDDCGDYVLYSTGTKQIENAADGMSASKCWES